VGPPLPRVVRLVSVRIAAPSCLSKRRVGLATPSYCSTHRCYCHGRYRRRVGVKELAGPRKREGDTHQLNLPNIRLPSLASIPLRFLLFALFGSRSPSLVSLVGFVFPSLASIRRCWLCFTLIGSCLESLAPRSLSPSLDSSSRSRPNSSSSGLGCGWGFRVGGVCYVGVVLTC